MTIHTDSLIEQYLEQAHQLMLDSPTEDLPRQELILLIERLRRQEPRDLESDALLMAERSFYEEEYKDALRGYLAAKNLPLQAFFCYRASAFLAAEMGQTSKALDFAKRALALQHNDRVTQWLFKDLGQDHSSDTAIHPRTDRLENVSLAEEEFNALAGIFQEDEQEQMEQVIEEVERAPMVAKGLDARIHAYKESQKQLLRDYLVHARQAARPLENGLYVLNSFGEGEELPWVVEGSCHNHGGYYLRWQGTGVVINPGKDFLRHFHRQGLHLHDIDSVVVTSSNPDCYTDIKALYDFNSRLNRHQNQIHPIQYYLNRQAYQVLAPQLKPTFKQEAGSLHSLELYVDSPDSESVSLSSAITMHYFLTSGQEAQRSRAQMGIWFDLQTPGQVTRKSRRLGYVSGTPWSPMLSNHLAGCDILLAGMENSCPADCQRQKYNEDSLGYHGICSLVEEIVPKLMLCCEFGGREGDIRLELVQKLRQEVAATKKCVVLACDNGLKVDLETLEVLCSITGGRVDPSAVRVSKTADRFGAVRYLSPSCIL